MEVLAQLADPLVQIANLLLVAFVIPFLAKWLGGNLNEKRRVAVESALQHGIKLAIEQLTAGKTGGETLRVISQDAHIRDQIADIATDYVNKAVPEALAKLGVQENVRLMVISRIDEVSGFLADTYIRIDTATSNP